MDPIIIMRFRPFSFILIGIILILGTSSKGYAHSEQGTTIVRDQTSFLDAVFLESPPKPDQLWITNERRSIVRGILGHDPSFVRVRYWKGEGRTVWIFDEASIRKPVKLGMVIGHDRIESVQILSYGGDLYSQSRISQSAEELEGITFEGYPGSGSFRSSSIKGLSENDLAAVAKLAIFLHLELVRNNVNAGDGRTPVPAPTSSPKQSD